MVQLSFLSLLLLKLENCSFLLKSYFIFWYSKAFPLKTPSNLITIHASVYYFGFYAWGCNGLFRRKPIILFCFLEFMNSSKCLLAMFWNLKNFIFTRNFCSSEWVWSFSFPRKSPIFIWRWSGLRKNFRFVFENDMGNILWRFCKRMQELVWNG